MNARRKKKGGKKKKKMESVEKCHFISLRLHFHRCKLGQVVEV